MKINLSERYQNFLLLTLYRIFNRIEKRVLRYIFYINILWGDRILVLGDSHADVFDSIWVRAKFPLIFFDVCVVQGATASGILNPNSKTKSYPNFINKLDRVRKCKKAIVQLGEVDTGFTIWLRAKKNNEKLETMLLQATERYIAFIDEVSRALDPVVVSCPLPTIADDYACGDVTDLRASVGAPQKERTRLAILFNTIIKTYCSEKGILYLDLDTKSLGEGGVVSKKLCNHDPRDHHYNPVSYSKLIAANLKKHL